MQSIAIVQTETKLRQPPKPRGEKLKSERVQQELATLSGWLLLPNGRVIERSLRFTSERSASTYAAYVSAWAGDLGQPVNLEMNRKTLTVKLFAPLSNGRFTRLDEAVLGFARQLS
jgi:pterin-4a-carbinolamine dehydratase